jgi:ABC-type transport system involved in multi-copper enzyme maturation permease subunit
MQDDPAGWLARRRLRHRHVIWLSLVTLGLGPHLAWMLVMVMMRTGTSTGGLYNAVDLAGTFLPVMLLLFITSRCFADARRGGEMELLLSTPLSARELVLGQWRALWQRLRAPFIVSAALAGFITIVSLLETNWIFGSVDGSFSIYQTAQCAKNLLCGVAACWLGLYLGLGAESVLRAVGYGLLWLVVGPWIGLSVIWFLLGLLFPATFVIGPSMLRWVLPVAINCSYLAGLLWWSRQQLIQRLRQLAARN